MIWLILAIFLGLRILPNIFYQVPLTKLGLTAEVLKNMYDSAVIGLKQETAYYDF